MKDTNQLPPLPTPKFTETIRGVPCITVTEHEHLMRVYALQARVQVQGEAFGYIHHFAAHDERGVLIDTTWEADGCADPLPHPTSPAMWKWSHCTPFYTTPQPAQVQGEVCPTCGETEPYTGSCGTSNNDTKALCKQPPQATQATPSIPSDGPSTYAQRFTAAVAVICGVTPPAALVCDWINKEERHDDLQQWVGSYAPGWVQNIAVLDAAHQMADQPTEGGNHEPAQQPATPASVQADSSEHLRVVASLGDALRRLSFAAQTTGGTDGPDAELQSAIGQAEQALSLGGIWQAMSATTEPVASRNPFASRCYAMSESHLSGHRLIVGFEKLGDVQDAHEWVARQGRGDFTHPAPSVPAAWTKDLFLVVHAMEMNNWHWKSTASDDLKREAHEAATRLYYTASQAQKGKRA